MDGFGVASYGTAVLAYGAIAAVLTAGHPGGRAAAALIGAALVSLLWAAGMAAAAVREVPFPLVVALESALVLAWTVATVSWFAEVRRSLAFALIGVSGGFAAGAVAAAWIAAPGASGPASPQGVYLALLGMGLVGLLAVEQLLRNAAETHRERVGPLCFGLGGVFVLNIFIYSQASLLGGVLPFFWESRGFASAGLALVIVIALKRLAGWERELFVSRQVVFYTASLIAVGGYLLAMGMAGFVIYALGGEWGLLLQSLFFIAAVMPLAVIVFSARIRARAKVLLVKHFYKNKYDYREEWLLLTERLGRGGDTVSLARNALTGIAGIVGSEQGGLWLTSDGKRYRWVVALRPGEPGETYDEMHPLVRFLAATGWVVDTVQYRNDPARYDHAFGEPDDGVLPPNAVIVPLDRRGVLQGFVVLSRPSVMTALNFEDHDILKTAGRQVAIVLAQMLAQEELAATRQFEAMNKLATFLMHDLKNVVAQQELVVQNARKFKHRPEFIDDAVSTMEAGARRMRSILRRLENAGRVEQSARVDLVKLLEAVCIQCADRRPSPAFSCGVDSCFAQVDRERIRMAVTHALRNAQDATPEDGRIDVRLEVKGGLAAIEVVDTGVGMSSEFIRDRLFKPFDSTKGAKGMGIGAYQIRETLRSAGGDVFVQSADHQGTTLCMMLPVVSEGGVGMRARSVA